MTLPLNAGTYSADAVHSSVAFSVRHLGLARVRGSFTDFTSNLVVGADLAGSSLTAAVDLASVNTGNAGRDAHLQGGDFFNTEVAPQMTFVSTSIAESGSGYTLTGDLTLNGITAPITLDGEFLGTSTFPMDQSQRAGFAFTGTLSRKAHGMEFDAPAGADKLMLGDKVAIELDAQFVL
jgi:polyisoprenoid-binding protein YceI